MDIHGSYAAMPLVRPYKINLVSQKSPERCNIACGAMMWAWKSVETGGKIAGFNVLAGKWLQRTEGMDVDQQGEFFRGLGLRQLGGTRSAVASIKKAGGANVRYALQWSPVVVARDDGKSKGHTLVVADHANNEYLIADPAGKQSMDFSQGAGTDSNDAAFTTMATGVFDRGLSGVIWYW